ncbi:MAG: hypothetical protein JNK87_40840 [Bryobacterales bacterium]|nr:hypothetical protein [Bryobacterales bacterium]
MAPALECVCIRCAQRKLDLYEACPACGFTPSTNEDYAKTLILSDSYVIFDNDRTRPPEQLRETWAALKAGTFEFDPLEVSEVAAFFEVQERYFGSLTKASIARDLVFHFGPMVGLVFGIVAFALYRRHAYVLTSIALVLAAPCLVALAYRIYVIIVCYREPWPDHSAYWLAEPRAVETAVASQVDPQDLDLPPEAAALFARFDRIAVRHTGVEIARQYVARMPGKPDLLCIGKTERGTVAIHRRTHKALIIEPSGTEQYESIGVLLTAICGEEFRHIGPVLDGGGA